MVNGDSHCASCGAAPTGHPADHAFVDQVAGFRPAGASLPELFSVYRAVLRELRFRGVVRTQNAPAGDYAEYLVARALDGELAPNSEKSFDLTVPDGRKIQVKCRVGDETGKNSRRYLSPFRSFDFDQAAVVLLSPDYTVKRAVLVPVGLVQESAAYNETYKWHRITATQQLLDHPGCIDITENLRRAAGEG